MKKALFFMLLSVTILFGGIFILKKLILDKEKAAQKRKISQVINVSATKAKISSWTTQLYSTGSLRTYKGVYITTELAGMIDHIYFTSGEDVKKGQVLVILNIKPDIAKLHELEANAELAKIIYFRDKKQFAFGAVSRQQLDNDSAQYKSTADLVKEQKATIDKKTIRAPFSGRLGISSINVGQYLNPGDQIVTIQTLDPIYADFYLPQQQLGMIHKGQQIAMTLDRAPNKTFYGKISTINPIVDSNVRNAEIQATLSNPQHILLPGMFSNITLNVGKPKQHITLPYTAVTFNPYGTLVYLLTKTNKKHDGKTVWQAQQQFVITSKTRGNQVAVIKGIKAGDMIVTAGQLKLRNKTMVVINNTVQPADSPTKNAPTRY